MKAVLLVSFLLVVATESAGQVRSFEVPSPNRRETNILCGMRIIPGDPNMDRRMAKAPPAGKFTLRNSAPRVCGSAVTSDLARELKGRRLPEFLGPKR